MPRAKPNRIDGQFVAHRLDMLESAAFASLSLAARRILDRLEIEHMANGGVCNGDLKCTYDDFGKFGVRRKSVAAALDELIRAGLVAIAHQGRGGNAQWRDPSRYRLTYLATSMPSARPPTDEWRRYSPPDQGRRFASVEVQGGQAGD